jgi:hypothetical protein
MLYGSYGWPAARRYLKQVLQNSLLDEGGFGKCDYSLVQHARELSQRTASSGSAASSAQSARFAGGEQPEDETESIRL